MSDPLVCQSLRIIIAAAESGLNRPDKVHDSLIVIRSQCTIMDEYLDDANDGTTNLEPFYDDKAPDTLRDTD